MKKHILFVSLLFGILFMFASCDKTDEANIDLNITGLEDLGSDYLYEGWIIVDGTPVTTGTFSVDENGQLSETNFTVNAEDLDMATAFVLTIEPSPDNSSAPSDVHILAGDFDGNSASLSIDHTAALNTGFEQSSGKYVLATPSDGMGTNELSGLWFLDLSSGTPATGMNLPDLPSAWNYEGWAVIDGTPVSTGTFTAADMADDSAAFSGSMATPPFPGEDFLMNAPSGLSFPTDLNGGMAVISVEPIPDNSAAPFVLKPLVGMIDANATDHNTYEMNQNLTFPTGTATK